MTRPRPRRGIEARSAGDAQAYLDFDKKVRAIASFLAYIAVATPPDPKSPSLADAIMGLKLGKAFRDLGGKTGREAVRALPMSVADLVQEVFADEAIRGPLATRGILNTAMGPWATGTAQVFLNDSAGTDGGAAGTAVFATGGTGALASALEQAAAGLGVQVRTGAEVVAIRNRGTRAIGVTLADGTELDAPVIVSAIDPKRTARLCDPVTLGPTMVWQSGNIRQPGAMARVNFALSGLPAVHGGDRRDAGGPHRDRPVDRRGRAGDGRGEVRPHQRGADAGGDDPVADGSVARTRGQACDERRVPGGALRAARRRLGRPNGTVSATSP